jgi:hypothetical protein
VLTGASEGELLDRECQQSLWCFQRAGTEPPPQPLPAHMRTRHQSRACRVGCSRGCLRLRARLHEKHAATSLPRLWPPSLIGST